MKELNNIEVRDVNGGGVWPTIKILQYWLMWHSE